MMWNILLERTIHEHIWSFLFWTAQLCRCTYVHDDSSRLVLPWHAAETTGKERTFQKQRVASDVWLKSLWNIVRALCYQPAAWNSIREPLCLLPCFAFVRDTKLFKTRKPEVVRRTAGWQETIEILMSSFKSVRSKVEKTSELLMNLLFSEAIRSQTRAQLLNGGTRESERNSTACLAMPFVWNRKSWGTAILNFIPFYSGPLRVNSKICFTSSSIKTN